MKGLGSASSRDSAHSVQLGKRRNELLVGESAITIAVVTHISSCS